MILTENHYFSEYYNDHKEERKAYFSENLIKKKGRLALENMTRLTKKK